MADDIKIKKSAIDKILLAVSIIFVAVLFVFYQTPYTAPVVFVTLLMVWGAYYAFISRDKLSEMCCMMSGMTYGMIAGFFIGAIVGLATSDFMIGMITGTVAGIVFGIPVGRLGGPLGRMEGVMAGPMGGIMGGMTGVMVRFFDVSLFMPFLVIVVIFVVWEMTMVIKKDSEKISRGVIYIGVIISLLAIGSVFMNSYSVDTGGTTIFQQTIQQPAQAAPSGGVQEITIKMEPIAYSPNYIVLKKDVPVKMTFQADKNAGCTRSIVMPAFNIRKTVAQGGTATVEFTPTKTGTFPFSCSMNMARGTIVVEN